MHLTVITDKTRGHLCIYISNPDTGDRIYHAMTVFGLKSKLEKRLKTELEEENLQISLYCNSRLGNIINAGVTKMNDADMTDNMAKIGLAEDNLVRLVD